MQTPEIFFKNIFLMDFLHKSYHMSYILITFHCCNILPLFPSSSLISAKKMTAPLNGCWAVYILIGSVDKDCKVDYCPIRSCVHHIIIVVIFLYPSLSLPIVSDLLSAPPKSHSLIHHRQWERIY